MNQIEMLMFEITGLFMTPVLLVLSVMFIYALFSLGSFLFDLFAASVLGRRHAPLLALAASDPGITQERLELALTRRLEYLRATSRVAPLLGLVATMIPMGPALIAVANGDSVGMAEQLVVAFAAVIVALMAAAITYVVLLVRRRWLLTELNEWLERGDAALSGAAVAVREEGL